MSTASKFPQSIWCSPRLCSKKLCLEDGKSFTFVTKGSLEIKVDSWDIGAFIVFMKIIHCRLNAIPRKLNLELLSKVAVLADYYGCLDIMGIFKGIWIDQLQKNLPTSHCRDLLLWLWISWAFRAHDLFQKATLTAMEQSDRSITSLGLPIPEKIIGMDSRWDHWIYWKLTDNACKIPWMTSGRVPLATSLAHFTKRKKTFSIVIAMLAMQHRLVIS